MTDELDLVRRFRADEPDVGEDTIMGARAALTRAIADAPTDPNPPPRQHVALGWRLRGINEEMSHPGQIQRSTHSPRSNP